MTSTIARPGRHSSSSTSSQSLVSTPLSSRASRIGVSLLSNPLREGLNLGVGHRSAGLISCHCSISVGIFIAFQQMGFEIASTPPNWRRRTKNISRTGAYVAHMPINWEAQRDMQKDVEENPDFYAALAGESPDDSDDVDIDADDE